MIVTAYKTPKIAVGTDLFTILDGALPTLDEQNIVVVTSKIVSICQGRVVRNDEKVDKIRLEREEAQYYIETPELASWDVMLTINHDILIANSGIDESNGNGYFILWPEHIEETITSIWQYLKDKHHVSNLGVIITDSRLTPLRWGTLGVGIAWCGFEALNNYIGSPDIFGKNLHATKASIVDGLAAASVVIMGEGNEQTPLALIQDVPFVHFQDHPPTSGELAAMRIDKKDDIYAPLIDTPRWQKGGK